MLEVNLGHLKANFSQLARRAGQSELLVLLKSDAYGHSHREVARALSEVGSTEKLHGFAVANVEEGIELRREKIRGKIYVLSGIQNYDEDMHRCLETCDLIPVISSLSVLRQAANTLRKLGSMRTIHLKVNSGMNRLGIDPEEFNECFRLLKTSPGLRVDGLMSHLACAEKKTAPLTKKQIRDFDSYIKRFSEEGIKPNWFHIENSAGLKNHLFPKGNISRVGLHLYGVGDAALMPVSRWTAQVYQLRDLKKGESVGYGSLFKAKRKMRMAVLGVGYGDGYRRAFSNKADVLIKGKRCRVIGAVSMDLTAVDVSSVSGVTTEDRAVLMGSDGRNQITAEELAGHAKCIAWEILTGISPRVPRFFING
jgi:alanine racemase